MSGTLVVVPCGRSKIWNKHPLAGPTPAADAYTGTPFKINRQYAERFGDAWVVLSAKYGFIDPGFVIPETYEVTFKKQSTKPIETSALRRQVQTLRLSDYGTVIGLGGIEYREAVKAAFAPFNIDVTFPFVGMPIGVMMRATKHAIDSGYPGFSAGE